jgi:hypothetical protein
VLHQNQHLIIIYAILRKSYLDFQKVSTDADLEVCVVS